MPTPISNPPVEVVHGAGAKEARRPPLILTPKPDADVHVATFIRQDGVRRQLFVFSGQ
jgi:hypothetical protein